MRRTRWGRGQAPATPSTCPGPAAACATGTTWPPSSTWCCPSPTVSKGEQDAVGLLVFLAGLLVSTAWGVACGGGARLPPCRLLCWAPRCPCRGCRSELNTSAPPHPLPAEFAPDLVIISAGFDAAEGDPIGGCHLTPEIYGHLAAQLQVGAWTPACMLGAACSACLVGPRCGMGLGGATWLHSAPLQTHLNPIEPNLQPCSRSWWPPPWRCWRAATTCCPPPRAPRQWCAGGGVVVAAQLGCDMPHPAVPSMLRRHGIAQLALQRHCAVPTALT